MLRQWLATVVVLALSLGGATAWYAMDRDGSLTRAQIGCGDEAGSPLALAVRAPFAQPASRGPVGVEIVATNVGDESVRVTPDAYEMTVYAPRWDARYEAWRVIESAPTEPWAFDAAPGDEAWIAYVPLDPWAERASPAGTYVVVARSHGACAVGAFEVA